MNDHQLIFKTASVHELKKELSELSQKKIIEHCLRLIKYKKDNKELLSYLIYDSDDEKSFIQKVKNETDLIFEDLNKINVYLAKKTIRKALRTINKYIKYSQQKETEAELRIYFCQKLLSKKLPISRTPVLLNLYENQLKKINSVVSKLHEDLQFDYQKDIEQLGII